MNRLLLLFLFISFASTAQQAEPASKKLTLQQVIALAREQSPVAKLASTQYLNKYWQYRSFKANYKPQLSLNGTLPDLTRSYQSITQNDGTDAFKLRSVSNSSLDLSLSQNISYTGSEVFMSSQLQRIDILNSPTSVNYLASPAVVGIRQPLFMFNDLKWNAKIEPLRFEESKKQFVEDMENVSIQATQLYFNLLIAQISYSIEEKNLANNDTLYQISKGRYQLGKIAENELLQMQLSVMNAQNSLAQAQLDVDLGTLKLKNFLKMTGNEKLELEEPMLIPQFSVDEKIALEQAKRNRQQIIEFERLRLEAQRDLAKARGDNRLNANLTASYGLTNSSAVVENLYLNPQEQQRLRLGFEIPIVDWGRAKAQIRTAQANKELIETNIEQAEQNFDQEIYLLVKQFNMYRQKLVISAKSDTIAQKRYDITVKRYMIGKISIVDLNIALQEKDQAKLGNIRALETFWNTYFELRRKTLYDFEQNAPIKYAYKY
jgi:outer membrane protein